MDQALAAHSVILNSDLFDMVGASGVKTNHLPVRDSI
jgi:hypothetical protein